jgi:hypothetical protein
MFVPEDSAFTSRASSAPEHAAIEEPRVDVMKNRKPELE